MNKWNKTLTLLYILSILSIFVIVFAYGKSDPKNNYSACKNISRKEILNSYSNDGSSGSD